MDKKTHPFDIDEPMLMEEENRYVLFPIKYHDFWKAYKETLSVVWTVEEIDLSNDYRDWVKLNENQQHFIKYILAFFAGSDGIVLENLGIRFFQEMCEVHTTSLLAAF